MLTDITGQRFGKLVAEAFTEIDLKKCWWRLFKCDCGQRKMIRQSSVLKSISPTQSCGCLQNKSKYLGVRSGKLVVIGYAPGKNKNVRLRCLCDCGRETVVYKTNFKNGYEVACHRCPTKAGKQKRYIYDIPLKTWSKVTKIPYSLLRGRMISGWSPEEILFTRPAPGNQDPAIRDQNFDPSGIFNAD